MLARLYKNTGFNVIDIPDGPHFFELNGIQPDWEFDNVEVLQINNMAQLTLDMNEWDGRSVDYVILIDTNVNYDKNYACYTVDGITMQAPGVCTFNLIEDSFNTLGGFNPDPNARSGNEIIGGSANRLSVSKKEDEDLIYCEPEPFKPTLKSKVKFTELISGVGTTKIIECASVPPQLMEAKVPAELDPEHHSIMGGFKFGSYAANYGDSVAKQRLRSQNVITVEDETGAKWAYVDQDNTVAFRKGYETRYLIYKPDDTFNSHTPGTTWFMVGMGYNVDANYQKPGSQDIEKHNLISDMLTYEGLVSAIIGYWEVPVHFIEQNGLVITQQQYNVHADENTPMGIQVIKNKVIHGYYDLSGIVGPHISGVHIYNNKAKYGQSRTLKVYSPASGESIDKDLGTLLEGKPNEVGFLKYTITSDIRKNGTPIFMWDNISPGVSQLSSPLEYIKGAPWRNITLRINGVEGEYNKRMQLDMQSRQVLLGALTAGLGAGIHKANIGFYDKPYKGIRFNQSTDQFEDYIGTSLAVGALSGAKGLAAGGVLGLGMAAGIAVNGLYQIHQQNQLLNAEGASAGANIQIGDSDYMRDAGENKFVAALCSYDDEDLKAFDTFLTRYGYAVNNRNITNADLYSRPGFNFVRVNDLSIRSIGGNTNLINRTVNQMKNGVRIWHRLPNPNDMMAGGNR